MTTKRDNQTERHPDLPDPNEPRPWPWERCSEEQGKEALAYARGLRPTAPDKYPEIRKLEAAEHWLAEHEEAFRTMADAFDKIRVEAIRDVANVLLMAGFKDAHEFLKLTALRDDEETG